MSVQKEFLEEHLKSINWTKLNETHDYVVCKDDKLIISRAKGNKSLASHLCSEAEYLAEFNRTGGATSDEYTHDVFKYGINARIKITTVVANEVADHLGLERPADAPKFDATKFTVSGHQGLHR